MKLRFHILVIAMLFIAAACAIYWWMVQQANSSFGHLQVEQVIQDRPEMGVVIMREPALRKALEAGFESELSGSQVCWDFREPSSGRPAEHRRPSRLSPTLVRVSKTFGGSGVDKCAMLFFELENAKFDKDFTALSRAAYERKVNRDDYAMGNMRLEFSAIRKTREYFHSNPLAESDTTSSPFYATLMAPSPDFSEYLRWQNGLGGDQTNVHQFYLRQYDQLIQQ